MSDAFEFVQSPGRESASGRKSKKSKDKEREENDEKKSRDSQTLMEVIRSHVISSYSGPDGIHHVECKTVIGSDKYTLIFSGFQSVDASALTRELETHFSIHPDIRVSFDAKEGGFKVEVDLPRTVEPSALELEHEFHAARNFAEGFWDHMERAYDKVRDSIASTAAMVDYYTLRAESESKYGVSIRVVAQDMAYMNPVRRQQKTTLDAWTQVLEQEAFMANAHKDCSDMLSDAAEKLKSIKQRLEEALTKYTTEYSGLQEKLMNSQAQVNKLTDMAGKLTARLVKKQKMTDKQKQMLNELTEELSNAKLEVLYNRNRLNQANILHLEAFQRLEMQRIEDTKVALHQVQLAYANLFEAIHPTLSVSAGAVDMIDAKYDTDSFLEKNATNNPCPWMKDSKEIAFAATPSFQPIEKRSQPSFLSVNNLRDRDRERPSGSLSRRSSGDFSDHDSIAASLHSAPAASRFSNQPLSMGTPNRKPMAANNINSAAKPSAQGSSRSLASNRNGITRASPSDDEDERKSVRGKAGGRSRATDSEEDDNPRGRPPTIAVTAADSDEESSSTSKKKASTELERMKEKQKSEREREERERKEKEDRVKREKEEKERADRERREKEDRDRKDKEEKERKRREEEAAAAAAAASKKANAALKSSSHLGSRRATSSDEEDAMARPGLSDDEEDDRSRSQKGKGKPTDKRRGRAGSSEEDGDDNDDSPRGKGRGAAAAAGAALKIAGTGAGAGAGAGSKDSKKTEPPGGKKDGRRRVSSDEDDEGSHRSENDKGGDSDNDRTPTPSSRAKLLSPSANSATSGKPTGKDDKKNDNNKPTTKGGKPGEDDKKKPAGKKGKGSDTEDDLSDRDSDDGDKKTKSAPKKERDPNSGPKIEPTKLGDFTNEKYADFEDLPRFPYELQWELKVGEWERACFELLLCSYGLLLGKKYKDENNKAGKEERKIIEDVIRVRLNVSRADYDAILKTLGTKCSDPELLLFVNHRFTILKAVKATDFPSGEAYVAWFTRQCAVVLSSLCWTVFNSDRNTWESKKVRNTKLSKQQLCDRWRKMLLKAKDDATSVSESSSSSAKLALEDSLEAFVQDVASFLGGDFEELDFPPQLTRVLYDDLVRTCYMPAVDDEDDDLSDEDDDTETTRLNPKWKQITQVLEPVRDDFQLSDRYHCLCLLRVLIDVIEDQSADLNKTTFDALVLDKDVSQCLHDTMDMFAGANKDPLNTGGEVWGWICYTFSEWLTDYHASDDHGVKEIASHYCTLMQEAGFTKQAEQKMIACIEASTTVSYSRAKLGVKAVKDKKADVIKEFVADDWKTMGTLLSDAMGKDIAVYCPGLQNDIIKFPGDISMIKFWDLFSADYSKVLDAGKPPTPAPTPQARSAPAPKGRQPPPKESPSDSKEKGKLDPITVEAVAAISQCRRVIPPSSPYLSPSAQKKLNTYTEQVDTLCCVLIRDFVSRQTSVLSERMERAVAVDKWEPIGSGVHHSSSVVDFFVMLDTILQRFTQLAKQLVPFGAAEVLSFEKLVTVLIKRYVARLTIGANAMEKIRPVKKIHTVKAKARLREGTDEKGISRSSNLNLARINDDNATVEDIPLEVLCVRLCCAYESGQQLQRLKPPFQVVVDDVLRGGMALPEEDEKVPPAKGKDGKPIEKPKRKLPEVFDEAFSALENAETVLINMIAIRSVYVDMKVPLLLELYEPSPNDNNSIMGGKVSQDINALMSKLFKATEEPLLVDIAESVYTELMNAFYWVLLYGGRKFEPQHEGLIVEDSQGIQDMFGDEVDTAKIVQIALPCDTVIGMMGEPSEELVKRFGKVNKSGTYTEDQLLCILILSAREDKAAVKFCKGLSKYEAFFTQ